MTEIFRQYPNFGWALMSAFWIIISGLIIVVGILIKSKVKNVDERVAKLENGNVQRLNESHKIEIKIEEMNTCIVRKIDGLKDFMDDRFVTKEHCNVLNNQILDKLK